MNISISEELLEKLKKGRIDSSGFYQTSIEFEQEEKKIRARIECSRHNEKYFENDLGHPADISINDYPDICFVAIYIPEKTFREVLMGEVSLKELIEKASYHSVNGPFRSDTQIRLVCE